MGFHGDHFVIAVSMYEFPRIRLDMNEICLTSEFTFTQENRLTIRAYSIKVKAISSEI